jgi:hypothetical protein
MAKLKEVTEKIRRMEHLPAVRDEARAFSARMFKTLNGKEPSEEVLNQMTEGILRNIPVK